MKIEKWEGGWYITGTKYLTFLEAYDSFDKLKKGDQMDIEKELRRNIKDLQEQLNRSHKRIKTLQEEIYDLQRKINPEASFSYSGMSGWALMADFPPYEKDEDDEGKV